MPDINGLPYPALSDPNNPPADFLALATAVDARFPVSISNGGTGSTTVAGAQANLRVGLVPISPSSVAVAGGSASANVLGTVTFTGTSISLNGVFTNEYKNYRFMVNITSNASLANNLDVRFRKSGIDNTSTNYGIQGTYVNGTAVTNYSITNETKVYFITGTSGRSVGIFDVFDPTAKPGYIFASNSIEGANLYRFQGGGRLNVTDTFDGITLVSSSNAFTGSVTCYGYND